MSAPTTLPTLMASAVNLSSSPFISVPLSNETPAFSLNSPVISTLASSQAITSQCTSFEDPNEGQETIFKLPLRSELPKKFSRCHGKRHKTITQSGFLLVRSYGISSRLNPKTGKESSSHGPLYVHIKDNCLKSYDSKNSYAPKELFNY